MAFLSTCLQDDMPHPSKANSMYVAIHWWFIAATIWLEPTFNPGRKEGRRQPVNIGSRQVSQDGCPGEGHLEYGQHKANANGDGQSNLNTSKHDAEQGSIEYNEIQLVNLFEKISFNSSGTSKGLAGAVCHKQRNSGTEM